MSTPWEAVATAPVRVERASLDRSVVVARVAEFGSIVLQLALIALVMTQADLLTPLFRRVLYIGIAGAIVNHLLPARVRLLAFSALCGATLLHVAGASPFQFWDGTAGVTTTVAVVTIGAVLVGICLAPIAFWARVALLAASGAGLALFRAGYLPSGPLRSAWPLLASLMMLRLIVYCYEVSTLKKRPRWSETFAYFALLPNLTAGLFPVVDFKTFVRSHYNEPALAIYQRGIRWIVRGMTHLVLYRIIKQLLWLKYEDVASGRDLVQYVVANSFLYLNVSGQYHIFIGLLLLFGFNLPESNRRYFLAASFNDYWRRANIYWKDFIQTVFYYPTYFRLKNRSGTLALAAATLWSFFVTWALHLYQTWWLTGDVAFTAPDMLFWTALALLVLANSLWEMKRGRQRTLQAAYTLRSAAGIALRTAGTFACISLLWSFWSAPGVSQWFGLWRLADRQTLLWTAATLGAIMAAKIVVEVLPVHLRAGRPAAAAATPAGGFTWTIFLECVVPLAVIGVVCTQAVQVRLDYAAVQPLFDVLNTNEATAPATTGYYERLTRPDQTATHLFQPNVPLLTPKAYTGPDPIRRVKGDFRDFEFLPNVHLHAYETDFRTNRWGMRDRDFPKAKAPGTVRIALIGASHSLGWGIEEDQTFKALLEKRLNAERPAASATKQIEVLNFSVYNRSPLGSIDSLNKEARDFEPDIVLLVTHPIDAEWVGRDIFRAIYQRRPLSDPFLAQIAAESRVHPRTPERLALERLKPFEPALLEWSYRRFGETARALHAEPIAIFVPIPDDLPLAPDVAERMTMLIRRAGMPLIDLTHLYDGRDPKSIMLTEVFHHTNAAGHALIADAVYPRLAAELRLHPASPNQR